MNEIKLAQAWWYLRPDEKDQVRRLSPQLAALLDELDRSTRGDAGRCICTSAPHHDPRCPGKTLREG